MANMNRSLGEGVETILLPTGHMVGHISASLVRQVISSGGNAEPFLSQMVWQLIQGTSLLWRLRLFDDCINCDVCEPACPNQAIYQGEEIFEIDPALCTECVGHFDEPECVAICPVDCIILDPQHAESAEALLEKYKKLQAKSS